MKQPRLNRRDLLQGRLWKLVRPTSIVPLVMRYPKNGQDVAATGSAENAAPSPAATRRTGTRPTIGGIAIEPVPATEFRDVSANRSFPLFRPPGAVDEPQFLAGCTRCSDCADACPHQAIVKVPERLGAAAGTPTIEADSNACLMCDDFPCISACKPGVLVDTLPKVIGTAKITNHLCLAYHSTTCTVCSERCPISGAIQIDNGKPKIIEDACTGCGVCRYVCPAPENAILLMPIFNRPSLPS